jgi:hypothetical protein
VLRGHSGLEALGGGSFEEVVRPPLGNCSLNTHWSGPQAVASYTDVQGCAWSHTNPVPGGHVNKNASTGEKLRLRATSERF